MAQDDDTDLERPLAQAQRQLSEALERQAATDEVLRVIASSPADLPRVFQAIVESAARLCEADNASIYQVEHNVVRHMATHGHVTTLKVGDARPIGHGSLSGRVIMTRDTVHIPDALAVAATELSDSRPAVESQQIRTSLGVPLIRGEGALGAIVVRRMTVRPFAENQIALLKTFAHQAVIAIENARLLKELHQRTDDLSEALEQQTATSEVLQVISTSSGELEPVFETILANAVRICEATFGNMYLRDGEVFRIAAAHNTPPPLLEHRRRVPLQLPTSAFGRMVRTKEVVHVADLLADPRYAEREPEIVTGVELGGIRTLLIVPMLKEKDLIGALTIYRQEVRPFNDKQIDLVKNFASQAVIAIENTRLLNELRELLRQQTATSEVLQVISSSPGELEPVFNAMLENAARICEASYGALWLRDGDGFRYAALHGDLPQVWIDSLRDGTVTRVRPDTPLARVAQTRKPVQVPDMGMDPSYRAGDPLPVSGVDIGGIRTLAAVPMVKDDMLVGIIAIYRKKVRPFTDKQIELVTNFASQAVIAIENTRLLNELRQRTDDLSESLEQQTATSEVLKVISSSPGELPPVFETMLTNMCRICDAQFSGLLLREGGAFQRVALHGAPPAYADLWNRERVIYRGVGTIPDQTVKTKQAFQVVGLEREQSPALFELAGARTLLSVPLIRDDEVIGIISIYRQEVRPFTDKQIELVSNFAAQAVIAIENTRLLNELREVTRSSRPRPPTCSR